MKLVNACFVEMS